MTEEITEPLTPTSIASRSALVAPLLHEYLPVTPLVRFGALSDELGAEVLVKCEHLQVTGSFKARGALAKALTLTDEQRAQGVVTASTGNHGLGVANAVARLGGRCMVFVPENASASKVAALRRFGAEIRSIGTDSGLLEIMARESAAEHGLTYIPPYNDADVIAGQGTVGVEIVEQIGDLGLDAVFVSVGGGGLISGTASVLRQYLPDIRVVGASPTLDAAMYASVQAGEVVKVDGLPTLSDGTAGNLEVGSVTVDLCRDLVDEWVLVDEVDIKAALRSVIDTEHVLVEGSAAVAFAAARAATVAGQRVAVVSCGANISSDTLAVALT
jgi:threonine dehydratase